MYVMIQWLTEIHMNTKLLSKQHILNMDYIQAKHYLPKCANLTVDLGNVTNILKLFTF